MNDIKSDLDQLYNILIDNFDRFDQDLKVLIANPEEVSDTNKFTWLISRFINRSELIDPFLSTIAESDGKAKWLNDYIFAAVELIDNASEDLEFTIPEGLIERLRNWLLHSKGELSWKSATLLKYFDGTVVEAAQIEKLKERGDFFLTYVECIIGLLRNDRQNHLPLVKEISDDATRDEKLREFAKDAYENYR